MPLPFAGTVLLQRSSVFPFYLKSVSEVISYDNFATAYYGRIYFVIGNKNGISHFFQDESQILKTSQIFLCVCV